MSNLIAATNYHALAEFYASARDRQLLVKDDVFDAVYEIVLLDELIPEVDLLNTFWNSYLMAANTNASANSLLEAVRALNNHVIIRGSYDDINDYFVANPTLLIPQTWQDLSADAGYDISDIYVG